MTVTDTLAAIRERADQATGGPWYTNGAWITTDRLQLGHCGNRPTAEFIAASRTDVPRLLDAVEKVLALHKPVDRGRVTYCCVGCEDFEDLHHESDCCHEYPCATVLLITDALGGDN